MSFWMKFAVAIAIILLTIPLASAQVVKVEMSPQTLLPNDVADCKLVLSLPQLTYVSGITFYHPSAIDVQPNSVSSVGWVQAYELPFTIKAKKSGIYTVEVLINTINGSIRQVFTVRVESEMPKIVLGRTTFTLNEVNDVGFTISSPLEISNIIVVPMFDANPKVIYVKDGRGSFKFEPKKPMPLKFKIEFYNGRNYHEIVQTVNVEYRESKGVLVNATPEYPITLIGDVMNIDVQISNLRQDDIYLVRINASDGTFSAKSAEIPMIKAGETKLVKFKWCARSAGVENVTVEVSYLDEFNNEHFEQKVVKIKVSNATALQFSGVEVERSPNGLTVTGDICNNGRSKVYNVMVSANGKTYYIDYLDPSDFDSFEIVIPSNTSKVQLKATWTNEIGERFEIGLSLNVPKAELNVGKGGNEILPLAIAIATLIVVLVVAVVAWKRR